MKLKLFSILFSVFFLLTGCDVVKQEAVGLYNMTQCKYEYNSISNLSVSGMNLSSGISALNMTKILALFSGQSSSIPLNFTLNLGVSNPNTSAALMQGLQYIVSIDGIQFTTGSVEQSLNVPAGGQQVLPLSIGFDLASMMKGDSKNAVTNIAKNFLGIGSEKSKVSVQIKPTFLIGNQRIAAPMYIPVDFSFGGK
ncbi:LEA type 2 family protein [Viscerimonas tarda]